MLVRIFITISPYKLRYWLRYKCGYYLRYQVEINDENWHRIGAAAANCFQPSGEIKNCEALNSFRFQFIFLLFCSGRSERSCREPRILEWGYGRWLGLTNCRGWIGWGEGGWKAKASRDFGQFVVNKAHKANNASLWWWNDRSWIKLW